MLKKNVLHIIDSLQRGGAESLLMNYIPHLNNYNNTILILNDKNDFKHITSNYKIINLNRTLPRDFLSITRKLKKIFRTEKIDIVHSHTYWTNIVTRIATPSYIKLFNHYHFADFDSKKTELKTNIMLRIDQSIKHSKLRRIAVSNYLANTIKNNLDSNVTTIPNFIPITQSWIHTKKINSHSPINMIAIGNLKSEKNYSLVLEGFKYLKHLPISIDIYGGGPDLEHYRRESNNANVNVNFMGPERNVLSRMHKYNLFCSSSNSETFGLSVLEGVASGIPLILSNIPAFEEIAPKSTIFFESDNVIDFARKIEYIYTNGLSPSEQSYNETISKYTIQHFLEKLIYLYNN